MNKVKTKNSEGFSGGNKELKQFFRPKTGDLQKKRSSLKFSGIFRPKSKIQTVFPAENRWPPKKKPTLKFSGIFRPKSKIQTVFPVKNRWAPKKKRYSSQKCHEIRCHSTKVTKIPLANTDLGLDLHSSSPEPVNFFGAQSSLGGAQFSFGRHGPGMPPRGAGPAQMGTANAKFSSANSYSVNWKY